MQRVTELVKQRARVVERQQCRLAVSALREIQYVDDDGRLGFAELVLRAEARHPRARSLRGTCEIIANENADMRPVPVEHFPGSRFGVIARQIGALFEFSPNSA